MPPTEKIPEQHPDALSPGTSASATGGRWLAWASSWKAAATLVLLCVAVYLPGLWSVPPVDRDECRFAQASRQMLESVTLPPDERDLRREAGGPGSPGRPTGLHAGGLAIPMYASTPRLNKPPLTYWLQAASAYVLTGGDASRDAMWMYRVPSVVAASLSVLLTWMIGRRMFDARAAVLAAAFLCVSPMVVWDAHQARSDQLLLLTTIASMGALWRVYAGATRTARPATAGERWIWPAAFWLALGLSVLAKGPIAPMVAVLAIAALCVAHRRVRWVVALRPVFGVLILGAVLLPWLLVIHREFGLAWYLGEAWRESFGRGIRGSTEGHFAPPGTHLVLSVALFWPGVMLALAGVARGLARGWPATVSTRRAEAPAGIAARLIANIRSRRAARGPEVFLLAWLIPAWIVFEASMAKLPHYTMPLYPAAALLAARMVFAAQGRRAADAGAWIWLLTAGLPAAGLIAGALALLFFAPTMTMATTGVSAMIILCACVALAGLALSLQFLRARLYVQAHAAGLIVAVLVLAPTLQWIAPSIVPGALSSSIAIELRAAGWTPKDSLASEHAEDSMVFQTRGRVVRSGGGTLEYTREHLPHFVVARWAQAEAYALLGYRAERDVLMPPGRNAPEDRLAVFVRESLGPSPASTPTEAPR